jgi:hypothetical protein
MLEVTTVQNISMHITVLLYWVPENTGVLGTEEADALAGHGSSVIPCGP